MRRAGRKIPACKFLFTTLVNVFGLNKGLFSNMIEGVVISHGSYFRKNRIKISGKNNKVIILNDSFLDNCSIFITGNNNMIEIGESCTLTGLELWIEDDSGRISIGNGVRTFGKSQFAVIEGKEIFVGNDCLFADNVQIRTGDSHSIISQGKRINPSQDVHIENHVWVCADSTVLKGVSIGHDSVIGAKSLVTKSFCNNVLIAGHPATEMKKDISWDIQRR